MRAQAQVHELAINPAIYAELSLAFTRYERLDAMIAALGLILREVPRPALFLAGKAFARYRRAGGSKTGVLPDFLIGAHAAVEHGRCSRAMRSATAPTFRALNW